MLMSGYFVRHVSLVILIFLNLATQKKYLKSWIGVVYNHVCAAGLKIVKLVGKKSYNNNVDIYPYV